MSRPRGADAQHERLSAYGGRQMIQYGNHFRRTAQCVDPALGNGGMACFPAYRDGKRHGRGIKRAVADAHAPEGQIGRDVTAVNRRHIGFETSCGDHGARPASSLLIGLKEKTHPAVQCVEVRTEEPRRADG